MTRIVRAIRLLPLHYFERDFVAYRDAAGQRAGARRALPSSRCAPLGHGGESPRGRHGCAVPFTTGSSTEKGAVRAIPYAKQRFRRRRALHSWPVEEKERLPSIVYFDKAGTRTRLRTCPRFPSTHSPSTGPMHDPARLGGGELCPGDGGKQRRSGALSLRAQDGRSCRSAKAWSRRALCLPAQYLDYPVGAGGRWDPARRPSTSTHYGMGIGVTYFRGIVDTAVLVSGTPHRSASRVHHRLSLHGEEAGESRRSHPGHVAQGVHPAKSPASSTRTFRNLGEQDLP